MRNISLRGIVNRHFDIKKNRAQLDFQPVARCLQAKKMMAMVVNRAVEGIIWYINLAMAPVISTANSVQQPSTIFPFLYLKI